MPTVRAYATPIQLAVKAVVTAIQLGGGTLQADIGVAPDCPPPYVIITAPTGGIVTGTLANPAADADHRIQITAVGDLPEQALRALDKVREALTITALQTEFNTLSDNGEVGANRKVTWASLDISPGEFREERGLPEPLFSQIDQYIIRTHPTYPSFGGAFSEGFAI